MDLPRGREMIIRRWSPSRPDARPGPLADRARRGRRGAVDRQSPAQPAEPLDGRRPRRAGRGPGEGRLRSCRGPRGSGTCKLLRGPGHGRMVAPLPEGRTGRDEPGPRRVLGARPGKGPGDHVRLEAALGGEGDQARADGGRREALPQPLPPGVATRDPALVDRRAQSRDGAAPREKVLSTGRGPRIQPCRKIVSLDPQRFNSMSTPTSVATNDPFLKRAAFRILRRSSSSANASSDRKNPKSISTRELTRTAPTSREPLSRTRPTIEVRRPRTRFRKPKQTTRPSAHSPARTFVYESRGSRP